MEEMGKEDLRELLLCIKLHLMCALENLNSN